MKVIIALTVQSNVSFPVKQKANQAILSAFPGITSIPNQKENKNSTTTITYNDDIEPKVASKLKDGALDGEIYKRATELREKLSGLAGLQKLQIWWKYVSAPVRPTVILLFD